MITWELYCHVDLHHQFDRKLREDWHTQNDIRNKALTFYVLISDVTNHKHGKICKLQSRQPNIYSLSFNSNYLHSLIFIC